MRIIINNGYSMYMWFNGYAIGSIACTGHEPIIIELEEFGKVTFVRYDVNNNLIQFIVDDYKISKICEG